MVKHEYRVKFRREEIKDEVVEADTCDWDDELVSFGVYKDQSLVFVYFAKSEEVLSVRMVS